MFPSIAGPRKVALKRAAAGAIFARTVITSRGTCGSTLAFAAKLSDKGWIGFFPLAAFGRRLLRRDYFRREKNSSANRWDSAYRATTADTAHRSYWRWMHAYFPKPEGGSTLEALVYDLPLGMVFRKCDSMASRASQ